MRLFNQSILKHCQYLCVPAANHLFIFPKKHNECY